MEVAKVDTTGSQRQDAMYRYTRRTRAWFYVGRMGSGVSKRRKTESVDKGKAEPESAVDDGEAKTGRTHDRFTPPIALGMLAIHHECIPLNQHRLLPHSPTSTLPQTTTPRRRTV